MNIMNTKKMQSALSYIGDDLIAEAADYSTEIKNSRKPGRFPGDLKYFAAAAAAVVIGAAGLTWWTNFKNDSGVSLTNPANSGDNISSIIDQINKDKDERDTAAAIKEFNRLRNESDFSTKGGIGTYLGKYLGDGKSSPGLRFASVYAKGTPTLSDWKNASLSEGVVWNFLEANWNVPEELWNDESFADNPKPGEVKMSPTLYTLITRDAGIGPIFAVKVSFPCIDEDEMAAWKYEGMTIKALADILKEAEKLKDIEMVQYFEEYLAEALHDYYLVKMQQFYDSFKSQHGLEIYPNGNYKDFGWFYCFMTAGQIAAFTCKSDEAFYLDLAYKD